MKTLIESITNEERNDEFRVSFTGCTDAEGMPITFTVLVPREYKKAFRDYLNREIDNTVCHADGPGIEI